MSVLDISQGWQVKNKEIWITQEKSAMVLAEVEGWMNVDLPCDVHMALIDNGIIDEPLLGDNAEKCAWVSGKSWWFKKVFTTSTEVVSASFVELTLEALDASADIYLNGTYLGHHRSAFYPFVTDIKEMIVDGENTLLVRVTSGIESVGDAEAFRLKRFAHTTPHSPSDPSVRADYRAPFVRKPQYVFGWDHVPTLVTCGMTGKATIAAHGRHAIRSVHARTIKAENNASVRFAVEVENFHPIATADGSLNLTIERGGKTVYSCDTDVFLRSGVNFIDIDANLSDAELWWPNGMGAQPLYTARISLLCSGSEVSFQPVRFGIRTVELDTSAISQTGRRFAFKVNGVRMYCRGGNWVPADCIYARVSDEKYEKLLCLAKEANFNMLRIWGGGIYEKEIFYEKCDELGLLLWHDFMFACAQYPDDEQWFRTEVEREAEYQTRRLRSHPSMALWSGNNENHEGAWYSYKNSRMPWSFGGSKCYNNLLPSVVHRNCPEIPYWNSSPYGGDKPGSPDVGDVHQWEWAFHSDVQIRTKPELYDTCTAKFVSEYGYVGPTGKASVLQYLNGSPYDRNGTVYRLHCNRFDYGSVAGCIARHYVDPDTLDEDDYLLYGGLAQGLMLGYSLDSLRFYDHCSGSIIWDFNDSWGETGWSVTDYYCQKKIAYYFVKRAMASQRIVIRQREGKIIVKAMNDTGHLLEFNAEFGYVSFDGKFRETKRDGFELKPYVRQTLLEIDLGEHDFTRGCFFFKPDDECVLPVVLRTGEFKQLQMPVARRVVCSVDLIGGQVMMNLQSETYAHGVHVELPEGCEASDLYFDMLPGEKRTLLLRGIDAIAAQSLEIQSIV